MNFKFNSFQRQIIDSLMTPERKNPEWFAENILKHPSIAFKVIDEGHALVLENKENPLVNEVINKFILWMDYLLSTQLDWDITFISTHGITHKVYDGVKYLTSDEDINENEEEYQYYFHIMSSSYNDENARYLIPAFMIDYGDVTVTNDHGDTVEIQGCKAVIPITVNLHGDNYVMEPSIMTPYLTRTSILYSHWQSGYKHSHVPGISSTGVTSITDPSSWCTGESEISEISYNTFDYLFDKYGGSYEGQQRIHFAFGQFLSMFETLLKQESNAGGPFKTIGQITSFSLNAFKEVPFKAVVKNVYDVLNRELLAEDLPIDIIKGCIRNGVPSIMITRELEYHLKQIITTHYPDYAKYMLYCNYEGNKIAYNADLDMTQIRNSIEHANSLLAQQSMHIPYGDTYLVAQIVLDERPEINIDSFNISNTFKKEFLDVIENKITQKVAEIKITKAFPQRNQEPEQPVVSSSTTTSYSTIV